MKRHTVIFPEMRSGHQRIRVSQLPREAAGGTNADDLFGKPHHRIVDCDGNNGGCPVLMTESELVEFLRIPAVSKSTDHHNVIENLKRLRNLPRIHICNKALYPKDAILEWIRQQTTSGN